MKKGAWNQLIALGFLYSSDCERYGKLLKDYQTDFADKADNFPRDLVSMRKRMSITCNEERFMKKKNRMQVQVTMWHMHQALHKLHKERRCVGFVVEIIWPMFVHTEIKFPVINGTKIPWSHTIHFLRVHMYIMSKRK